MPRRPERARRVEADDFRGASRAVLVALTCALGGAAAHASGETRSLTLHHTHTNETATVTFRRGEAYDPTGLEQLSSILRDWRVEKRIEMDPRLFDILWEVYRESGSREPIHVISAYRSPDTNEMLRQRSGAVAEHSQHTAGKAIDVRLPDVDPARLRAIAMRLQRGGVGYYASSNFVHIDTGSVRAWPRMSLEQLARLFPDGKTVHLPPSGKPLPGYEVARAEIAAREGAGPVQAGVGSGPTLLAFLGKVFGAGQTAQPAAPAVFASATPAPVLAAAVPAAVPVPEGPPSAEVPLPPRRPTAGPLVVTAAWPLANLAWLPAPARPAMDWAEPNDLGAVRRALLTTVDGGSPAAPATITVLRASAHRSRPDLALGEPDPAVLARMGDGPATARSGGQAGAPPAPAREASAAR